MVNFTKRPRGSGRTSRSRRLSAGSSAVLLRASSLRSFARSQPPWTKVSLPSGRTSVIVAWRSTFGFDARTQTCSAPAPMTVVFALRGLVRYETALPAGGCSHLYGGVAVQRPFSPPRRVAGEVRERPRLRIPGERVRAGLRRRLVGESAILREEQG